MRFLMYTRSLVKFHYSHIPSQPCYNFTLTQQFVPKVDLRFSPIVLTTLGTLLEKDLGDIEDLMLQEISPS